MSNDYFWSKTPRMLTQVEVVDIHLLVKSTRPILGVPSKFKQEKSNENGK